MTEREKRDKIIENLEWAIGDEDVYDCLYVDDLEGVMDTMKDALTLIKALDVTPEELERLKLCRHECKVDCLLESFNRVVEERDTLLKDREPRVMTLEEVKELHPGDDVYIERISSITGVHYIYAATMWRVVSKSIKLCPDNATLWFSEHGETWRCWTSRPTDAQREEEPWAKT